jgi:hypothetical protein
MPEVYADMNALFFLLLVRRHGVDMQKAPATAAEQLDSINHFVVISAGAASVIIQYYCCT